MANLRQVSTPEHVDREAECIKRFLESEKEPVIIAWGTKEGMESYQASVYTYAWNELYKLYGERLDQENLDVMDSVLKGMEADLKDRMKQLEN